MTAEAWRKNLGSLCTALPTFLGPRTCQDGCRMQFYNDVLQVHRKVVASVCTCCPSCAETEEGQLSRDVRYSEADKEDLLSYALESICKLETKKSAFKCHLADLVNGFLTEFETARQNERYNQRKHLHGSYNTKWKL